MIILCNAIVLEITLISPLGEYYDCHSVFFTYNAIDLGRLVSSVNYAASLLLESHFAKFSQQMLWLDWNNKQYFFPVESIQFLLRISFKTQYRNIYYAIAPSVSGHDPHRFLIPYSTRYIITHIHTLYYFFIIRFLYSKTHGKVFHWTILFIQSHLQVVVNILHIICCMHLS